MDRPPVVRALMEVSPALSRFIEVQLEALPQPVSMVRYRILRRLAQEQCRNSELAARVRVSSPTASAVIDSLAKAGWVERKADPRDRRAVVLALTGEGRQELRRTEDALEVELTELLSKLDPDDARLLHDGLVALKDVIDQSDVLRMNPASGKSVV
ncbi:MAG: MarR family winged helix-turn-helix transcriptional regulator [Actinomycetota bacterium]